MARLRVMAGVVTRWSLDRLFTLPALLAVNRPSTGTLVTEVGFAHEAGAWALLGVGLEPPAVTAMGSRRGPVLVVDEQDFAVSVAADHELTARRALGGAASQAVHDEPSAPSTMRKPWAQRSRRAGAADPDALPCGAGLGRFASCTALD